MEPDDRLRMMHRAFDQLEECRPTSVIAGEICALGKEQLVERVRQQHEVLGSALMPLADLHERLTALCEIIAAAEARLAAALAVVEAN